MLVPTMKTSIAVLAFAFLAASGMAQTGNGAQFGTRNTRDCNVDVANPTPAQLTQAFICESEVYTPAGSSGAGLTLVSDVHLQVAPPRRYNPNTDAYEAINTSQPVYDVRGNYISWGCMVPVTSGTGNAPRPGKNCFKYIGTGVHGIAFRDTFRTWHVKLCCVVSADGSNVIYYPPPTNQY